MKNIFVITLYLLTINTQADLLLEQTEAYKKGKSCIEQNYAADSFEDFDKLYSKVSCVNKVQVNKDGEIENLNCPEDPLFEDFFTNGKSHTWNNSCIRSDRNTTLKRFENVNCDCVTESLKAEYKDSLDDKMAEFKKNLTSRALKNIGSRLLTKIDEVKNTDRAVSAMNESTHCFNENTKLILQKFLGQKSCSEKIAGRINDAFGDGLGLDINDKTTPGQAIDQLINGLNSKSPEMESIAKKSCFENNKEFNKYYNSWSTHPGAVKLGPIFDEFIKGRDLDSYSLNSELQSYLDRKNIKLHPTLQSLVKQNTKELLLDIDRRDNSTKTLDDFLNANDGKWRKKSIHTVNKMCAYVIKDLHNTLCPSADFAYDDPEFIDMVYKSDDPYQQEMNDKEKIDKDLELKALYCKKKELHSIDSSAKSLALKAKYKKLKDSDIKTQWITGEDFHNTISNFKSGDFKAAKVALNALFDKSFGGKELPREVEQHRKLGIVNSFMDAMLVDGKILQEKNRSAMGNSRLTLFFAAINEKKSLERGKENSVREMARELYKIKSPKISADQFEEDFTKNYKDRNYTKKFTEYLSAYGTKKTDNNNNNDKCAQKFSEIYCGQKDSVMKGVTDTKKLSCFKDKIPDVMLNFLSNKYKDVQNPQSICDFSSKLTDISSDSMNEITGHITKFYNDTSIYEDNGFCSEMMTTMRSSQEASTYSISNAKNYGSGPNSGDRSVEVESESYASSSQSRRDALKEIAGSLKSTSKSPETRGTTISSEIMESLNTNGMSSAPKSVFGNFNNNLNTSAISTRPVDVNVKQSDIDNQEALNQSNQDLLDYIKQLEKQIASKQSDVKKAEKSNNTSEVDSLLAEINTLKSKTAKLKKQLLNPVVQSSPTQVAKTPQPKSQEQSFFSNVSNRDNRSSGAAPETSVQADTQVQSRQPASSVAPSLSKDLSLTSSNISDGPSGGAISSLNNKTVSINYNNQDYKIELKVAENGELICSFADEESNTLTDKELESICEDFLEKEKSKSRDIASKEKEEEEKKVEAKKEEEPKRLQQFKVKDLNSILEN
jgi:hypothetical protein